MRTTMKTGIIAALVCLTGVSLISSLAAAPGPDLAVIVNPENPAKNLTLAELRKIYRGERQYWSANTPVLLLMRSTGARERDVILRFVFDMTDEQYTQYWVAKVMRAEAASQPAPIYSHGMMQEGVRGNAGAIGYVQMSDVRDGVKVLRVNGLLPGDPGYPLH